MFVRSIAASIGLAIVLVPSPAGAAPLAATPVISPAPGVYSSGRTITITCASPSPTIRYTTDGSRPTGGSALYTGAFSLPATAVVRAVATAPGLSESLVATAIYVIESGGLKIGPDHTVVLDGQTKLLSWLPQGNAYGELIHRIWDGLVNAMPTSGGLPYWYLYSYMGSTLSPATGWPNAPGGQMGMLADAAIASFPYTGNTALMDTVGAGLAYHLAHGQTPMTGAWQGVPYNEANPGATTYAGGNYSSFGWSPGVGDGTGNLEPDKVAELGMGYLWFYMYDPTLTEFRDAAIRCADALAANRVTATSRQVSPWPFRVRQSDNTVPTTAAGERFCGNVAPYIRLFDGLIRLGLGDTAAYQTTRDALWTWATTYPIPNNDWANYFEDQGWSTSFGENQNQLNPGNLARLLLEQPGLSASSLTWAQEMAAWIETNFADPPSYGALPINEQSWYMHPMGSHTSRFGAVNALLYAATANPTYKEKAFRALNWATYMNRTDGWSLDGYPLPNQIWFTDGFGDTVRHMAIAMAAVPEWAPAGEDHLLSSTSVVQAVTYGKDQVAYTTFDAAAREVLRLSFVPAGVTAGGVPLPKRTDLAAEGWTWDGALGVLRVRHDGASQIIVSAGPSPLAVSTPTLPGGTQGNPYTAALVASGGTAPYTWSIPAGLPPGLSLNVSTGAISGTPTTIGAYSFTTQVTDAVASTATAMLSIEVIAAPPLSVITASLPGGTQYLPYSAALAASGGLAPYTWSVVSGSLPPGLTLNATGNAISGTPSTPGSFSFTLRVTDAVSRTATRALNLTVAAAPLLAVVTTSLPGGTQFVAYSATLTASGGLSPYSWSISGGALPPGLTLNGSTGAISGTPSSTGTYLLAAQVRDAIGSTASAALSIDVLSPGNYTIWPSQTVPVRADGGADSSVELGVKFRSDVAGQVIGIRFYKAATNTGMHVASLWTSTGTRLATATFAGETASGWQQVNFATPVAIAASTVYVASYHASTGHYSADVGYFATKGVDSLPLHALANGVSGGNGVFRYGASSVFPNQTWNSTNYWVDVVFRSRTLLSIAVTPSGASIPRGSSQQFVATGTYSDGTTGTLTSSATWTSSSPGVATVTSSGLATAVAAGTTTISAGLGTVIGSTSLSVVAPPTVVTTSLPGGTQGVAYTATLSALGGSLPLTWSVTAGALPVGLTLSSSTGLISGTPSASGSFAFTVQVADALAQTATKALSISVATPLAVVTASLPGGTQGVAYTATLVASGGTLPLNWSVSTGALPPGLTLNASTGVISGTPSTSGSFAFTVQVADALAQTASKALSISVAQPLAVVTASLQAGTQGVAYSATLTASGGTLPLSWSVSTGALPPGLTLNASTGVISGTPSTSGSFAFTFQVADAAAQTATKALSISVAAPLAVITASPPGGTQGVAYTATLSASGGTLPLSWSVSTGTLPAGLTLNSSTGVISGTPSTSGSFAFTVQVADALAQTATKALSISVAAPLAVVTASLPGGTQGVAYTATLVASGGTLPLSWSVITGTLPAGLTLNSSTGVISGTPSTSGSFAFTVQVADALAQTATKALSISVTAPLAVVTASLPGGTQGVAYTATLVASGGTLPLSWSVITGTLPAGLTLNASMGVISGTPSAAGSFAFTVQVADALAQTATKALSISVAAPLAVVTTSLPGGTVGVAYTATLSASGGTLPLSWSVSTGALPAGLTLDASTGVISGTPTALGSSSFAVQVTDASAQVATRALGITIIAGGLPTYTAFGSGAVPGGTAAQPGPIELGVKFRADVDGFLTGVRFYKAATNTGTHVGNLWTSTGTKLATATFTGETASGWQQVDFAAPVAITAGTVYVASYHTSSGVISYDRGRDGGRSGQSTTAPAGEWGLGPQRDVRVAAAGTFPSTGYLAFQLLGRRRLQPGGGAATEHRHGVAASGTAGVAYTVTLSASGGSLPLSWSVSTGVLPEGLTLNASTGEISGTPSTAGSFAITVQVTDASAQVGTQALGITIVAGTQATYTAFREWGGTSGNSAAARPGGAWGEVPCGRGRVPDGGAVLQGGREHRRRTWATSGRAAGRCLRRRRSRARRHRGGSRWTSRRRWRSRRARSTWRRTTRAAA